MPDTTLHALADKIEELVTALDNTDGDAFLEYCESLAIFCRVCPTHSSFSLRLHAEAVDCVEHLESLQNELQNAGRTNAVMFSQGHPLREFWVWESEHYTETTPTPETSGAVGKLCVETWNAAIEVAEQATTGMGSLSRLKYDPEKFDGEIK